MTRQHGTSLIRGATPRQASPMTVDITRLGRRPGAMVTLREAVLSPSRIGLEMIAIDRGSPLELDLRVESVSEGVLVTGTVAAPTVGECARCLTPVNGRVQVRLTELFAYPDSATEATTEEDEVGHIVDDTIDLEQSIIDAVVLDLPFSPVCTPDCPGLCPECGVALAAEPGHHHDRIDSRWAKLADLLPTEPTEPPEPDISRDER
ncbi:MAG: YceD family protein [Mycobacterium sp.]